MANMAVEARVSVSAIRGRFEQIEGSSPNSHLSTSPVRRKISTSPVRNNASPTGSSHMSVSPVRRKISSSPVRSKGSATPNQQEKENHPAVNDFRKFSSLSANSVVNHGANLGSFEDPLDGLARRINENQQKDFRRRSDTMPSISVPAQKEKDDHSPIRKNSNDNSETKGKSGIIRRIPVFKSIEGGLLYDRRRHSKSEDDSRDSCEEDEKSKGGTPGRTSRFLGHIRSKSNGGGNVKRDLSVDKNEGKGVKDRSGSQTRQKENILTREWRFFRQKSSDNLYNNNNNHSNNNNNNNNNNIDVSTDTFEGKQKLVENIVKNMKSNEITLNGGMKSPRKDRINSDNGKEKSKSMKKFSFTSKTEKELKNKIEKEVITPQKITMLPVLPLLPVDRNKSNVEHITTEDIVSQNISIPSTPQLSRIIPETEFNSRVPIIPHLVPSFDNPLNILSTFQSSGRLSPEEMDTTSPCSDSSHSTPLRPPRRRSGANGLPHRKKNKAPSPPTSGSDSRGCDTPEPEINVSKITEYETSESKVDDSECQGFHTPESDKNPENDLWEDSRRMSWCRSKRMESASQDSLLVSPSLPDINSTPEPYSNNHSSREQSPDYLSHSPASLSDRGSPLPFTTPTSSEPNSPIRKTSFMEIKLNREELRRKQELDKSTNSYSKDSVYPIERTQSPSLTVNAIYNQKIDKTDGSSKDDINLEENKTIRPVAIPPKKPPRTFAYDIYKSTKSCVIKEKNNSTDKTEEDQVDSNYSIREPLYAMPKKKRSTEENYFIPQNTAGSSFDISKVDLNKPSIAPKPAHIVKKHKRLSMADPLSPAEKEEDPALSSEFQRQAHIRFSLRRPKKPPPAPPTNHNLPTMADSDANSYSPTKSIAVDNTVLSGPVSMDNAMVVSKPPPFSSRMGMLTSRGAATSRSTTNLQFPSFEIEEHGPMSLGHSPTQESPYDDLSSLSKKRSMSDETLYKGTLAKGEEPIYATPMLYDRRVHERRLSVGSKPGELHYMCSVLFTGEDEAAGRDGSRNGMHRNHGNMDNMADDRDDGAKGRSSLISAWKREFRQSCRQVHNKIKKSVAR